MAPFSRTRRRDAEHRGVAQRGRIGSDGGQIWACWPRCGQALSNFGARSMTCCWVSTECDHPCRACAGAKPPLWERTSGSRAPRPCLLRRATLARRPPSPPCPCHRFGPRHTAVSPQHLAAPPHARALRPCRRFRLSPRPFCQGARRKAAFLSGGGGLARGRDRCSVAQPTSGASPPSTGTSRLPPLSSGHLGGPAPCGAGVFPGSVQCGVVSITSWGGVRYRRIAATHRPLECGAAVGEHLGGLLYSRAAGKGRPELRSGGRPPVLFLSAQTGFANDIQILARTGTSGCMVLSPAGCPRPLPPHEDYRSVQTPYMRTGGSG